MPRASRVRVIQEAVSAPYGLRSWLSRFAGAALEIMLPQQAVRLSIVLADDATIRRLNQRHLGQDHATDVLSFGLETGAETEQDQPFPNVGRLDPTRFLGEVIVSLTTADRQAAGQGHSLRSEVAHLVVHGMLHLNGHDHDVPAAAGVMEREENRLISGVLEGVAERDRQGVRVPPGP